MNKLIIAIIILLTSCNVVNVEEQIEITPATVTPATIVDTVQVTDTLVIRDTRIVRDTVFKTEIDTIVRVVRIAPPTSGRE